MEKHEQEQLNKDVLPVQEAEQEFTLEDILREFGSEAQEKQQEKAETPKPEEKPAEQLEPLKMQREEPAASPIEPSAEQKTKEPETAAQETKIFPEETEAAAEEIAAEEELPQPVKAEKPKQKKPKKADKPAEQLLSPEELLFDNRQKLGKSRLRLALCTVICLLSLFVTVYCQKHLQFIPFLNDPQLPGWISTGLFALCAALCFDVIAEGIRQVFSLRPNVHALITLCSVFIAIDAVMAIRQGRYPFSTVGSMELTFGLWGLSDGALANVCTLKAVQAADPPAAVCETPNIRKAQSGLYAAEGDTEQFMRDFAKKDLAFRVMGMYVPVMLLLCIGGAAAISALFHRSFIWCAALLLTGAAPLCASICYTRPFAILAVRLQKLGAALCGWEGAKIFSGRHTILISDADVFPPENISFNGMKLYGGHDMNRVISYAAAVTAACKSPLADLFDELRQTQNCRRYDVRAIRSYEGGGVGADIQGEIILMGSLKFANSMGVHMDAGMKVKQAIYLSVNGELACVFAMKYKPVHSVANGLDAIVSDSHFDTVLVTRDFLLNPAYLQSKYGVDADFLEYPPVKEREMLADQRISDRGRQGAILGRSSFAEFAAAVAGGRDLRTCVQLGTLIALIAGLFGTAIMALMAVLGAVQTASCMNAALLLLLWALPGLLLSRWTKKK